VGAVAGIYCLDGREAPAGAADSMLAALAHRGPDGKGVWAEGPVALGQRTLATTAEAVAHKAPFAGRGLVVAADTRIDNRDELVAVLGLRETAGDGELIAAAYEAWREGCPDRLVGDFAFCLWDSARETLFCARDPFGVRPLHYSYAPGRLFALASEIKALLPLPGVSAALNQAQVARFLDPGLGEEDPGSTVYEDVQRLPAGHSVEVRPGGISLRRYWGVEPPPELRLLSDEAYAEAFRETFFEAVRCRLQSPAAVGAMLSGGLDSSSIVCVARVLGSGTGEPPLPTFSLDFETPGADERAYVDAVLAGGGLQPRRVNAEALKPLFDIDRFHRFADEPYPHLAYLQWAVFEAAAAAGVRVLLDGVGGDQILSATGYLPGLARGGRWLTLGREVDAWALHHAVPRSRILWQYVLKPAAPQPVRTLRGRLRARAAPSSRGAFLDAELAKRVAADGPVRLLHFRSSCATRSGIGASSSRPSLYRARRRFAGA
jgi:asparagine synthase (glutamine-hydrolysing)